MSDLKKASPVEIMADLLNRYTPSSLLKFQQRMGEAACGEITKELHYKAESMRNQDSFYEGFMAAIGYLDPDSAYFEGPVPSKPVTVEK